MNLRELAAKSRFKGWPWSTHSDWHHTAKRPRFDVFVGGDWDSIPLPRVHRDWYGMKEVALTFDLSGRWAEPIFTVSVTIRLPGWDPVEEKRALDAVREELRRRDAAGDGPAIAT